jgi:hypothetical protein
VPYCVTSIFVEELAFSNNVKFLARKIEFVDEALWQYDLQVNSKVSRSNFWV